MWALYSRIICGQWIARRDFSFLSYRVAFAGCCSFELERMNGSIPTYVDNRRTILLSFHETALTSTPFAQVTNSHGSFFSSQSSGSLQSGTRFALTVPMNIYDIMNIYHASVDRPWVVLTCKNYRSKQYDVYSWALFASMVPLHWPWLQDRDSLEAQRCHLRHCTLRIDKQIRKSCKVQIISPPTYVIC